MEVEGQGVTLHCHLADIVPGQQLQPILWAVSTLPQGEILDHVPASHRLAQQEKRDLCQLPPQSKQADGQGQVLVYATVFPQNLFFLFGTENRMLFSKLTLLCMPDDLVLRTHETVCSNKAVMT